MIYSLVIQEIFTSSLGTVHESVKTLHNFFFYDKKELKIFYFEFKRLSSRYIFQVKTSLQSSGGMVVRKRKELYIRVGSLGIFITIINRNPRKKLQNK